MVRDRNIRQSKESKRLGYAVDDDEEDETPPASKKAGAMNVSRGSKSADNGQKEPQITELTLLYQIFMALFALRRFSRVRLLGPGVPVPAEAEAVRVEAPAEMEAEVPARNQVRAPPVMLLPTS